MFSKRTDHGGPPPVLRRLWREDRFRAAFIAVLFVLVYLAARAQFGPRGPEPVSRKLVGDVGEYRLEIFSFLSPGQVVPGTVSLSFSREVLSLEIGLRDPFTHQVSPSGVAPRRLSNRVFRFPVDENLHLYFVRIAPKREDAGPLRVTFQLRPSRSAVSVLYLAGLSFFTALFLLWSLLLVVKVVRTRSVPAEEARRAVLALTALFLLFLGRAIFRLPALLFFFEQRGVPLLKVTAANLGLALGAALLYLLFRKERIPFFALPSALALLPFPLVLSYDIFVCGDAEAWIAALHQDEWLLRAAEFLSFPLVKTVLVVGRRLVSGLSALQAWTTTGKVFGVLWFFSAAYFARTRKEMSGDNRVLFFILTATLPVSVFFLGFPEFAYYTLPFLLLAAAAAEKYLGSEGGLRHLAGAAALVAVSGLMHAVAFVSLPPLMLFPFLKDRASGAGRMKRSRVWGESLLPPLVGLGIAGSAFLAAAISGLPVSFDTVLGGGDRNMFVGIARSQEAQTLFGPVYNHDRAWMVLTAFPLVLLLAVLGRERWKVLKKQDLVPLLLGLPALFLFLFWDYDLGFRDFDLYIAPLTLMNVFLVQRLVDLQPDTSSLARRLLLVAVFALTSPAMLVLFLTSAAPF